MRCQLTRIKFALIRMSAVLVVISHGESYLGRYRIWQIPSILFVFIENKRNEIIFFSCYHLYLFLFMKKKDKVFNVYCHFCVYVCFFFSFAFFNIKMKL